VRVGAPVLFAVLSTSLASSACTPVLAWRGRSDDRRHEATVWVIDGVEELRVDDVPRGRFDQVDVPALRWVGDEPVVRVREASRERLLGAATDRSWIGVGEVAIEGDRVIYEAADRAGWHLVVGELVGPAVPVIEATSLVVRDARAAAIARDRAGDHVLTERELGPAWSDVRELGFDASGRVSYVAAGDDRERLLIEDEVVLEAEEILELARATDAPGWAAIVADGEQVALVHGGQDRAVTERLRAALLTHLRISTDGEHVACLVPAASGGSIALWRDGAIVAQHRRVEGASLVFVPGTDRLVVLAEEAQGIEVRGGTPDGERFERITELVTAQESVGFVGARGGSHEVWIDGVRVGRWRWAGSLRLGQRGRERTYLARDDEGQRFVITRRGRWPVPRVYVDTLTVDSSGRHWAALAPDPGARTLEVWVDGLPRARVDPDELGSAMAASGSATIPVALARRIVSGELARFLADRAEVTSESDRGSTSP